MGDVNTSFLSVDHLEKKKINKETSELKHSIEQIDLTDTYSVFHLIDAEHSFFSAVHETFPK
jgi:hypothetical protein